MMDTIYHTQYYEYENKKKMNVVLCNYGAQLYSVTIDGQVVSFTLWNRSIQMNSLKYYGKTVGPICGRIPGGILPREGNKPLKINLPLNENNKTLLHFGEESLAFKEFFLKENDTFNYHEFIFSRDYVDEANDHFFDAHIEIIYQIYKRENTINLIQRVTPKNDTYYSLTNHSYFCVSRTQRVTKNKLYIDAKKVGLLDEDLLLKKYIPVDEKFDFSTPHLIGDFIYDTYPKKALGYDHPWLFTPDYNPKKPRIVLTGDKYELSIFTDYEAAVIYTNNYNDIHERMLQRDYNRRYDGIAIEPQIEPFNFKKMFIKGGTTRENYIKYSFKEIKK